MKIRFLSLLLLLSVAFDVAAQSDDEIFDYYNLEIDRLVAEWQSLDEADEEKSNPVYAKMFVPPILYSSVLNRAFDIAESTDEDSEAAFMDDKRSEMIDVIMLNMYRTAPVCVKMTEEELQNEKSVPEYNPEIKAPVRLVSNEVMPVSVDGGMKTTVVKPNYWRTSGSVSLTFTQNFVSGNWFQGGESNKTMLGQFDFNLNYDDKDRITFKNHFDVDLGFATTKADTLHSFRTNTDRLRIESTFGYKLVKNLDLTVKMKLESQSLPNYPVNTPDFVSNFMAPFDANFSLGLNYKPSIWGFNPEIFFAPLSAYNYKFVRYGDLVSRYGIRDGRHHKEDFGTQLIVTIPTVKIFKIVNFWSRGEFYTNYARAFFQLETKFDVMLNKYFKASLNMHARFDDSAPGLYDNEYGYWQIKELMTFGLTYTW